MANVLRRSLVLLMGLAAVTGLVACSSGAEDSTAKKAPEELRASATEVAAGLKKIEASATGVAAAAATDKSRAKQLAGEIEPVWATIEGTVKANDKDAYLAFEDSFALLEKAADDGDAAKGSKGADAVTKTSAAYLAKHPG